MYMTATWTKKRIVKITNQAVMLTETQAHTYSTVFIIIFLTCN